MGKLGRKGRGSRPETSHQQPPAPGRSEPAWLIWAARRYERGHTALMRHNAQPARAGIFIAAAVAVAFFTPLIGLALLAALVAAGVLVGGRSEIAVLATYIILLMVIGPRYTFSVYETTPAVLLALGCFALWAGGRAIRPASAIVRQSVIVPATLALGGIFLFTYGLGMGRPQSPENQDAADRSLIILMGIMGLVLLAAESVRSYRQLRRLLGALMVGASVLGLAAVLQFVFRYELVTVLKVPGLVDQGALGTAEELRLGLKRASGIASHPLELGSTSITILPIAFHFVAYARTKATRFGAMAVSLLLFASVFMSLSRSAMIGFVVVLAFLLPSWHSQRRFKFIVAAIGVIAVASLISPNLLDALQSLVLDWQGENIEGASLEGRTGDYDVVRAEALEHIWFGGGYGTHVASTSFATDNQYLDTLLETGVVGVFSLIAYFFTAYGAARRVKKRAVTDERRDLAQALAVAVLVNVVVFATYDALAFQISYGVLFFLIGCVGALDRLSPVDPIPEGTFVPTTTYAPTSAPVS